MQKVNFDNFATDYQEILANRTSFFAKDVLYFAKTKAELARRIVPKAEYILDYGCGNGENTAISHQIIRPREMFGYDPSPKSITVAKTNNKKISFTNKKESLKKFKYDLIMLSGVVHHIPPNERPEELRFLRSLLSEDGSLVIFEHNPLNPITRKIVRDCEFDEDAILIGKKNLIQLAAKEKLKTNHSGYFLFFPPALRFFLGFEKYMGWLPLGGQYYVSFKKN